MYDPNNRMKYSRRPKGNQFDGGDYLKECLTEARMTQKELACRLEISPVMVSNYIRGFYVPSRAQCLKMALELDIDISEWRKRSKDVDRIFTSDTYRRRD